MVSSNALAFRSIPSFGFSKVTFFRGFGLSSALNIFFILLLKDGISSDTVSESYSSELSLL